ncbi:uncharacterized protein EI97DRAFT_430937 [Westerdykella ornata]|uniref:Uncharacterized protein n=1 Tax=Westerdykella ornata TaxID=318751 RepID=A0A6A6JQY2_WESOR|nr:uncharacterized protein EI97DRAFT_430937 [Westerdykella ornata]KAF2278675.1 hypothetical protein EI97DRAFT_430937 [Westerdykella ornata]
MISLASLFLLIKLIMITVVGLYFAEKCGYTSSEPSHQAFVPRKQLRPHLPPYATGRSRLDNMHTAPTAPFPLVSERPSSRSGLQSQELQRAVQEAVARRTGSPVRTRSRSSTASSASAQSRGSEGRTRSPLKMSSSVSKSKSKSRSREREEGKEESKERRRGVLRRGRSGSSGSSGSRG